MNSGTNSKTADPQPLECLTLKERPWSSPTLFDEAEASKKTVLSVKFLFDEPRTGSYGE